MGTSTSGTPIPGSATEAWGWYSDDGSSPIFDGQRLRVAGLDVSFQADMHRWSGTWLLDGETRNVILERPHPAQGAQPTPILGTWEGGLDPATRWNQSI